MDTDFHQIFDENLQLINEHREIIIGDKVRIGCRCVVLKGTKMPNNSILGAGSIIGKQMKFENSIYLGNPVICIKQNIFWNK